MRPTLPKCRGGRQKGVTLIELIVAMVLIGIIVAATIYFAYPLRQSVDIATRAELTDIADNALQRIGREVRLALPNSVRVGGGGLFLEFLPVRTAGRYRVDGGGASSGTDCPATADAAVPASDKLSFGFADSCFKSIGTLPNAASITARDFVVLNNYGDGFAGQNAYEPSAPNARKISSSSEEPSTRQRIEIAGGTFNAALHDSPGRRFFVVNGHPTSDRLEPVSFECNAALVVSSSGAPARSLVRWASYDPVPVTGAQPATFANGTAALIATNVEDCSFDYNSNAAPQVGLLTLRLTLAKARSDGTMETVTLYHAIHVSNVP